jgi:hypothetical protein
MPVHTGEETEMSDTTNPLEVTVKFSGHKGGDAKNPKVDYSAIVVFDDLADAVRCGAKFVVWTLQRQARDGNFPTGRTVRVNSKGEFEKTPEETVSNMTPEQMAKLFAALQAKMQAAATVEMATATEPEPEELSEEELEAATAPEPEKKASANRTSGKKK